MKKLAVIVSVIVLLLCCSEMSFAQKKRRVKRTVKPASPTIKNVPCKEEVSSSDGMGPGNSDYIPPVAAKPCPKISTGKVNSPLKILSKPGPYYTEEARKNNIQGTVRLRVTFLASGQIANVLPVTRLPYGLTEQAMVAARKIRFEPQKVKGRAVTVSKIIEYNFTIY